tara:strand:- start:463 stop:666 length:204 start_codon:yes stop_codon:yes gene_type:complete
MGSTLNGGSINNDKKVEYSAFCEGVLLFGLRRPKNGGNISFLSFVVLSVLSGECGCAIVIAIVHLRT